MPKLFWDVDEGQGDGPAYARGASTAETGEKSRVPLDVPPELRQELELPDAEQVEPSDNAAPVPKQYRKTVAGKAVALDARQYNVKSIQLFSAVVDAMTSLSLPVDSVDSPSGIVTTDWVRKTPRSNASLFNLGDMFGGGNKPKAYRHRFIVRVFKIDAEGQPKSRLEIRIMSQVHISNHWVNKKLSINPSSDLFAAVEKQLGLMQTMQAETVEATSE